MPPMTPIPPVLVSNAGYNIVHAGYRPALVSAAASFGPAATFMPASMTGWLMAKSLVRGVENKGWEGAMVVRVKRGQEQTRTHIVARFPI